MNSGPGDDNAVSISFDGFMTTGSRAVFLSDVGSHTVVVTATDNGTPPLMTQAAFLVTVISPFEAWRRSSFTPAQLAIPDISDPAADPDRDGVINLREYGFSQNPLAPDSAGLPTSMEVTIAGEKFLGLRFTRRKAPVDIRYRVQTSEDLQTWNDTETILFSNQEHGSTETAVFRDTSSQSSRPRRNMRVLVEKIE
jgi:hypothetical protein